jgi:hypothetical protein
MSRRSIRRANCPPAPPRNPADYECRTANPTPAEGSGAHGLGECARVSKIGNHRYMHDQSLVHGMIAVLHGQRGDAQTDTHPLYALIHYAIRYVKNRLLRNVSAALTLFTENR